MTDIFTGLNINKDDESCICAIRENPSLKDFPGVICSNMYTSCCTMKCRYCHNSQLLLKHKCFTFHQLNESFISMKRKWQRGLNISGGEAMMNDNLISVLKLSHYHHFLNKIDTNLSCPDNLSKCLPYLDYIAFDMKTSYDEYPYLCHYSDIDSIHESLSIILSSSIPYEARITLIPEHHSDNIIKDICIQLKGCHNIILQPFIPHDDLPDHSFTSYRRCPESFLSHARKIMQSYLPFASISTR